MNLLVHAPLSEPPTEALPFRYVLSSCKIDCGMEILLECEEGSKDLYWDFLKRRGMFDFISDIVNPLEEKGLRLDTKVRNQQRTVVVKYIRIENQVIILDLVKKRYFSW